MNLSASIEPLLVIILALVIHTDSRRANSQTRGHLDTPLRRPSAEACVSGYCLGADYNKLEMPTSDGKAHVKMNLEVIHSFTRICTFEVV